jgi:Flp pilus assembly protein TadB
MNSTSDFQPSRSDHPTRIEASEEVVAVTGGGLRIVEVAIVTLLGLLVCPPFFILAVVVAVPVVAIAALAAGVVALITVPIWLVRRVRAHHRKHHSTLFLHRVRP